MIKRLKIKRSRTPLHYATLKEQEAVVKLLLESGADKEAKDQWGRTPLHFAASKGQEALVRLLIEKGADKEAKDKKAPTPLHIAAYNGHKAVGRLLIEQGADKEARTKEGRTPLHLAAVKGHEALVRLLIEKGAELEDKDQWGRTPLHVAVVKGDESVVRLLIEQGADKEAKDKKAPTPLHIAVVKGDESVVRLLIEKGADKEAKTNNGMTPLHIAAYKGHKAIINLLIEKGADKEAKTNNGRTPLHVAAESGHEAIINLLIEKGAELEAKNKKDNTPLDLAKTQAIKELLQSSSSFIIPSNKQGWVSYLKTEVSKNLEQTLQMLISYNEKEGELKEAYAPSRKRARVDPSQPSPSQPTAQSNEVVHQFLESLSNSTSFSEEKKVELQIALFEALGTPLLDKKYFGHETVTGRRLPNSAFEKTAPSEKATLHFTSLQKLSSLNPIQSKGPVQISDSYESNEAKKWLEKCDSPLTYRYEYQNLTPPSDPTFILAGRKPQELLLPTSEEGKVILVLSERQIEEYKEWKGPKLIISGYTPNDRRIAIHTFIKNEPSIQHALVCDDNIKAVKGGSSEELTLISVMEQLKIEARDSKCGILALTPKYRNNSALVALGRKCVYYNLEKRDSPSFQELFKIPPFPFNSKASMEDLFLQIFCKLNPKINCKVSEHFTLDWHSKHTTTGNASSVVSPIAQCYSKENLLSYGTISPYHQFAGSWIQSSYMHTAKLWTTSDVVRNGAEEILPDLLKSETKVEFESTLIGKEKTISELIELSIIEKGNNGKVRFTCAYEGLKTARDNKKISQTLYLSLLKVLNKQDAYVLDFTQKKKETPNDSTERI